MAERRGNEALALHLLDTVVTPPRSARLPLEVAQRVANRRVMAVAQRPSELGFTDPEQDAHALGRLEGQIEPRDAALGDPSAQQRSRPRILTSEQVPDL